MKFEKEGNDEVAAIKFLEARGFLIEKPFASIQKVLDRIDDPKPSSKTIIRAAKAGLFEAKKNGFSGRGAWLIDDKGAPFSQWLSRWQNAKRSVALLAEFADSATDRGRNDPV